MKFHRPSTDFWVALALVPVVLAVIFTGTFQLALAAGGAAFCVWLVVRIINRQERWAKWTAATMIALLVAYPLSFGPAHWYENSRHLQRLTLNRVRLLYAPLHSVAGSSPVIERSIRSYVDLWSPENPIGLSASKLRRAGEKNEAILPW